METDQPTPVKTKRGKVFSFDPKGEQRTFLESLVAEKGSVTVALQHCVDQAMNPPKGDQAVEHFKNKVEMLEKDNKAKNEFLNQYREREKQFQAEISNLKSQISSLTKSEEKSEKKPVTIFSILNPNLR